MIERYVCFSVYIKNDITKHLVP